MSSNNDGLDTLLALVLIFGGGAFAIYLLLFFWPVLVFVVLPFALMSGLIYWCFKFFTKVALEVEEGASYLRSRYNYRALLITYSLMVFTTLMVFHAGSERTIYVDEKGKQKTQFIEWPKLHNSFNRLRSSAYKSKIFKSLNKLSKRQVLFDRKEFGWIIWVALFLGGPSLYLYSTWGDDEDLKDIKQEVRKRVKIERDLLDKARDELDETISARIKEYKEAYSSVVSKNKALASQIVDLKTKLEYSSTAPKPSDFKGSGVLDRDDF